MLLALIHVQHLLVIAALQNARNPSLHQSSRRAACLLPINLNTFIGDGPDRGAVR